MRLLTFGSVDRAYNRLAQHIHAGQHVLDLGCGTGALSIRAACRGALVKGIDVNVQMLEIAAQRAQAAGLAEKIALQEMGVAELDGEASESFDAVTSGLFFSELSADEMHYTLEQVRRILRPGGLLLIADEVEPADLARRALHFLIRAPLVVLTYLLTQQTTHAVDDLPAWLANAGFSVESVHVHALGSFIEVVARKPAATAT